MIDDGADSLQVKRRMGHANITTALTTYGHLFPDREEDLVAALDRRRARAVDAKPGWDGYQIGTTLDFPKRPAGESSP